MLVPISARDRFAGTIATFDAQRSPHPPMDEPDHRLRFTATMITSDARAVARCVVHRPAAVHCYRHLYIRALTAALEHDDGVSGNFAAPPTTEC
jgi:hypothetical protein